MRIKILILIGLFSAEIACGQGRLYEALRGSAIRTNVGVAFPLTKLKTGDITDNLIEYENQQVFWQAINLNILFNNIGLNLTLQLVPFQGREEREREMIATLQERYGENYIVRSEFLPPYYQPLNVNVHPYAGFSFAKRWKRWAIIPKFQIGLTSFDILPANFTIKERNVNRILAVDYDFNTQYRPQDNFTLMTGFITEFALTSHLMLDLNIQGYMFKTKFRFTETVRDTFTEEISQEEFDYTKWIHQLSIGIGLAYRL
ncbi:MAG: hypothetical protein AAFP19_21310 [Bacteroidota bacterium]